MMHLSVRGVSCRYESISALDNVELSVNPHEFVGIIGPNGSGKTTLLRAISRVLRPILGAVLVNDEDVYSMKPIEVARKIAVVPQDSSVNFNFTALEVVLMGRNPHIGPLTMETRKDLLIAEGAMNATNCLHLANRRINELSGGERRRVIIARALAQEPQVLLLDEPTLNLDINNQIELMEVIRGLSRETGIIVLSVFHDFNLAARYSDKILLMKDGRVVSLGTPEKVITQDNLREVFAVNVEVSKHPITRLCVNIISLVPRREGNDRLEYSTLYNSGM